MKRKISQKNISSRITDKETLQRLISVTDDMLKTLITMSSALLGVGFIFDDFVKTPLARVIIILLFFIGLIISFLGVLPFNIRYDIEDEEELSQQQVKTFLRKRHHLWISAGVLAAAFAMAIIDLLVDVIKDVPVHP